LNLVAVDDGCFSRGRLANWNSNLSRDAIAIHVVDGNELLATAVLLVVGLCCLEQFPDTVGHSLMACFVAHASLEQADGDLDACALRLRLDAAA